jgi:hypothetical protein
MMWNSASEIIGSLIPSSDTGRRARRSLFVVALILMAGGMAACSLRGDASPPRPDPSARELERRAFTPEARRDIFVRQGLRFGGRTGPEVRTQLGLPGEERESPVPQEAEGAEDDRLLTWVYPGLEVILYRSQGGRRVLTEARVREDRHLTFPELRMGVDTTQILRVLGPPDARSSSSELRWEYRCGRCTESGEPVQFVLEAGRIVRVDFFFPRF